MAEGVSLPVEVTRMDENVTIVRARLVDVEGVVYRLPDGQWRATGAVRLGAMFRRGDPARRPVMIADAEFEAATREQAEDWLDGWGADISQKAIIAVEAAVHVDPNGSRG